MRGRMKALGLLQEVPVHAGKRWYLQGKYMGE